MNIDPVRRDIAALIALAEAVAERAADQDQDDLARFARRAAHRFQACVLTADPPTLAVARFEVDRLLSEGACPAPGPDPDRAAAAAPSPRPGDRPGRRSSSVAAVTEAWR